MKTEKKYFTSVGGKSFKVNDEKTHIYFHDKWIKLDVESWGETSFQVNGSTRYLDSDVIGTI